MKRSRVLAGCALLGVLSGSVAYWNYQTFKTRAVSPEAQASATSASTRKAKKSLRSAPHAAADEGVVDAQHAAAQALAERANLAITSFNQAGDRPHTMTAAQMPARGASLDLSPAQWAQQAKDALAPIASLYGVEPKDLQAARTEHVVHAKQQNAPVVVALNQRVNGIEVQGVSQRVVMRDDGVVAGVFGSLASSEALRDAEQQRFALRDDEAAVLAAKVLTKQELQASAMVPTQSGDGCTTPGYQCFAVEPAAALTAQTGNQVTTHVRSKPVFFAAASGALTAAYYNEVETLEPDTQAARLSMAIVSARDGKILRKGSLESSAAFKYRVHADPATAVPHPNPFGLQGTPVRVPPNSPFAPTVLVPNLIELDNLPFSRGDDWLAASETRLNGNNISAFADLVAPDGRSEGDQEVLLSGPSEFDYVYDFAQAPDASPSQRSASVTTSYYVLNFLHDWFYDAGWDENSRNPQAFNYGRGGEDGDAIRLDVQDFSGRNNANASTPADGASPRIQFYVFDGGVAVSIQAPAPLAGAVQANTASFGPAVFDIGSTEVATVDPALVNNFCAVPTVDLTGKIAYADRGVCSFGVKAQNAQAAGAIALVIGNNTAGVGPPGLGGTSTATIPTISVTQEVGTQIKNSLVASTPVFLSMARTASNDRDGALDSSVTAHEWGHVLSNRLIGNASGISENQSRGLGEGWSDVVAMLMTVHDEDRNVVGNDLFQAPYTVGAYADASFDSHYYGIRRVPYSTNTLVNGLTFKHIQTPQTLPPHPMRVFGINSQVHNTGEVWATMVWECYASLLNTHPFVEAQDRMKRYLVAGLAATPLQPTLLQARDALLAAAAAADPADYTRFATAFAKRGAGAGAKGPESYSSDHLKVTESFSVLAAVEVTLKLTDNLVTCDADGILDASEEGVVKVTLRNTGHAALGAGNVTLSSQNSANVSFPDGNAFFVAGLAKGASVTRSVRMALNSAPDSTLLLRAALDHPELPVSNNQVEVSFPANLDVAQYSSAREDFNRGLSHWGNETDGLVAPWKAQAGTAFVPNTGSLGTASLVSPPIRMPAVPPLTLEMVYRYSFEVAGAGGEAYDGLIVEFSQDGVNWFDLWEYADGLNYNAVLQPDNPLGERGAYTAQSPIYPAWRTDTVELSDEFAGLELQFRLVMASDGAVGAYGFELDRFEVLNAVAAGGSLPFNTTVAENSVCAIAPNAVPGRDQVVTEFVDDPALSDRTVVRLDASGSTTANGSLTYYWAQVGGPTVTLTDESTAVATFVANVSTDVLLTFELTVTDSVSSQSNKARMTVRIIQQNRLPEPVLVGPSEVDELRQVTLSAADTTDADLDGLTFQWAQTAGPVVTLGAGDQNSMTFTAPRVQAETTLSFTLTVDDETDTVVVPFEVVVYPVNDEPVVDGAVTLDGNEGSLMTLAGFTVTDADGEVPSLAWTQLTGPTVTLNSATVLAPSFIAPAVLEDTTLTFLLTATDVGAVTDTGTATVMIRHINNAPVVTSVVVIGTPRAGDPVALVATASDGTNAPLAYAWAQTAGASVGALGTTSTIAVVLPADAVDQVLTFAVTVTAPDGATATMSVNVTVLAAAGAGGSTGSSTGADTGSSTGSDTGASTGSDTGSSSGADTGATAGAATGETITPSKGGCSTSGGEPFAAFVMVAWAVARRRRIMS